MSKGMRLLTLAAVLALMAVGLTQGCGLKADPAPQRIQPLKSLTDVTLQEDTGGIFIRWKATEQPRPMTRFKLFRSEFGTDGGSCPGCPPDEARIADLAIGEAKLVRVDAASFGYRDGDVRPGRLYRYRVTGCDRSGFCSEPSAPVEWRMPDAPGAR
jgi:hypothetical protein